MDTTQIISVVEGFCVYTGKNRGYQINNKADQYPGEFWHQSELAIAL